MNDIDEWEKEEAIKRAVDYDKNKNKIFKKIEDEKIKDSKIERMDEIVNQLQGTGKSIEEVLNEGEEQTIELNDYIDQRIFCCKQCDWWCEQSEMSNEDWICEDCIGEE